MTSAELPNTSAFSGAEQEFFDGDWYHATYPDTAGTDPWGHFTTFGDSEGRSPGPGFDASFYSSTYLRLEAGGALRHFLDEGRDAGFLPLPRVPTAEASRSVMEEALSGLSHPVVLIGNDAQQAGAPLLLLEIARHLRGRGYSPVILLLRAGPLLSAFEAVGPTLILAEGHDLTGLGQALTPETIVLGNTALSAPVLAELAAGRRGGILIHEMPEFLVSEGLVEDVGRAPVVVASFPNVASRLVGLLHAEARVASIQPGLLHVAVGPQSTARVRDTIRATLGQAHPIFLGAGYADSRKGFDRFVAMAHGIREREPESGFIWLGELSAWARDIAERALGDGLRLMLPGFRADAAAWYDNADVYLLTRATWGIRDGARCARASARSASRTTRRSSGPSRWLAARPRPAANIAPRSSSSTRASRGTSTTSWMRLECRRRRSEPCAGGEPGVSRTRAMPYSRPG